MYNKTMGIVSYITLIGWIIAFVSYSGESNRNELNRYHLRQAFGLFLLSCGLWIIVTIVASVAVSLAGVINMIGGLVLLVFFIMGVLNAANEARKPLPLIGEWAEANLNFIK